MQHFAIYCNTIPPKGSSGTWSVDSTLYFDDIKAVNTNAVLPVPGQSGEPHHGSSPAVPAPASYRVSKQGNLTIVSDTPVVDTTPAVQGTSVLLDADVSSAVGDFASEATAQKQTVINIALPSAAILRQLNGSTVKSVELTLGLPHPIAGDWGPNANVSLNLSPDLLQAVKLTQKDVILHVVDRSTQKELYCWTFRGSGFPTDAKIIGSLNLALKIRPSSPSDAVTAPSRQVITSACSLQKTLFCPKLPPSRSTPPFTVFSPGRIYIRMNMTPGQHFWNPHPALPAR